MTTEEWALDRIAREHEADGDGGYAHALALAGWIRESQTEHEKRVDAVFSRIFTSVDSGLYLEALVQCDEVTAIAKLIEAVKVGTRDEEWRDDVMSSALRARGAAGTVDPEFAIEYVLDMLRRRSRHAIPALAAVVRVARDSGLRMAAEYFATEIGAGRLSQIYVATLVKNYLDISDGLLPRLIVLLSAIDRGASQALAARIVEALDKPWMKRELAGRADVIREQVIARSRTPSA